MRFDELTMLRFAQRDDARWTGGVARGRFETELLETDEVLLRPVPQVPRHVPPELAAGEGVVFCRSPDQVARVASRCLGAGEVGFEDDAADAARFKLDGRREPGDARADDRDITVLG